jgi:5-methylcytosine-specific restriction endonuclease McrA
MLFPKSSLPKMPPSDWKKKLTEKPIAETKKETVKPKPKKPISKISKKKKKRLKETGGEKAIFLEVWNEKPHNCEVCGKALKELKAHTIDHKIPKSRGEKYRLDKSNLLINCFSCHYKKSF